MSAARTIYTRLSEARSMHDARRIVEEEFQRQFGVGEGAHGEVFVVPDYHIKLSDDGLNALTAAIWRAWKQHRSVDV